MSIGHKFHIFGFHFIFWTIECFAKFFPQIQELKVTSYFEHGHNFLWIKLTLFWIKFQQTADFESLDPVSVLCTGSQLKLIFVFYLVAVSHACVYLHSKMCIVHPWPSR